MTTSNNHPYIDSTSNVAHADSQMEIYKDMGGLDVQLQAGNPILNFIQGDPSSNVMYGDFVPNESDGGSARMYAYENDSNVAPESNMLPPVPSAPSSVAAVVGVDIKGSPIIPDSGQYIPTLTSPNTPFLGDQPGISASKLPESETSPVESQ